MKLITTRKRRFVHRRHDQRANTACVSLPKYYERFPTDHLIPVTRAEAERLHACRHCFPDGLPEETP